MSASQNPPFDAQGFLSKVGDGRTVKRYTTNETMYEQGEPAEAVFYLQEGKAKVTVLSEQGKEAIVAFLSPGDFFGEGSLARQLKRLATVTAVADCLVTCIPKELAVTVLRREAEFSELFIAHLLARNSRVEADLVDQLFNSSEKRLARALLLLANFGKESEPEPILATISQETLAEMIGTTRSRVSYFMNKFRRLGLISYNGQIEVHRSLLNVVLHEVPEISD